MTGYSFESRHDTSSTGVDSRNIFSVTAFILHLIGRSGIGCSAIASLQRPDRESREMME